MTIDSSKKDEEKYDESSQSKREEVEEEITIASIVGEYGFYQLSLTLLTFIRFLCAAMMTNIGPLIAPSVDFWCQLPANSSLIDNIKKPDNSSWDQYMANKCQLDLKHGPDTFQCTSWKYNITEHGVTLTDTFNLVCDDDWYRSAFQSIISTGVVLSSVIWGSFSDMHGRSFTIRVCFICSLISGTVSYLASNFVVYAAARAVCSFGDVGLVVSLSTIIVETLGSKYRGAISIIVYTGWAFGVMMMPWITEYFRDYRQLMLFTVICHILTLPWVLTTQESIRWLMANGRLKEAEDEVLRVCKWNRKYDEESLAETRRKFDTYKQRYIANVSQQVHVATGKWQMVISSCFGGLFKVKQLFQTRSLALTTLILIWTTFTCEFLYMLFILINSDIGDDVKLNYFIGGIMETLATLLSIVIISRITRIASIVSTLVTISCHCFTLAFVHESPVGSLWVMSATKLAISTLSSLVFVATSEAFPTNLRQTGYGICGTLGSLGAVAAPFVRTELKLLIGMTSVLIITSFFPLIPASIIPFTLRETKGVELSDKIDDIHSGKLAEISATTEQTDRRHPA